MDTYGCLLSLAEKGAGCNAPRDENLAHLETLPQDQNLCPKMAPLNRELRKQSKWIEKSMAAGGCVPSCTRHSYRILDGVITDKENDDLFYYDYDLYGSDAPFQSLGSIWRFVLNFRLESNPSMLYLIFTTKQATMELTKEELVFTGIDLIASIGGYLGLYLGASVISLYELGSGYFRKMCRNH